MKTKVTKDDFCDVLMICIYVKNSMIKIKSILQKFLAVRQLDAMIILKHGCKAQVLSSQYNQLNFLSGKIVLQGFPNYVETSWRWQYLEKICRVDDS